jgi:hypothetical protein
MNQSLILFKIITGLFVFIGANFKSQASDGSAPIQEEAGKNLESILSESKNFDEAMQALTTLWKQNCSQYAQAECNKKTLSKELDNSLLSSCLTKLTNHCEKHLTLTGWVARLTGGGHPIEGWKLHVSGTSKSALKIARIVLSVLEKWKIDYKIAPSLDFLNNQLTGTQKGKFITIYPTSHNLKQIALDIEQALGSALQNNILEKSDFELLTGDAMLGTSGGLYARYGNLYGTKKVTVEIRSQGRDLPLAGSKTYVEPTQEEQQLVKAWIRKNFGLLTTCEDFTGTKKSIPSIFCIRDNREVPWPDFMNDRTLWSDTSPFGDLQLTWQAIEWKDRPATWKFLKFKKRVSLTPPTSEYQQSKS